MDYKTGGYVMIAVSSLLVVMGYIWMKQKKHWLGKAALYGFLASMMVQLFAMLFVLPGNIFFMLMNGAFLAIVTYNMYTTFGLRMAKIYEADGKNFYSFFFGNAVIANAVSFIMVGMLMVTFQVYKDQPEIMARVDPALMKQLTTIMKSVTIDYIGNLLIGTLCSLFITYSALKIFMIAFARKSLTSNLKGLLVLMIFYMVNLFIPFSQADVTMQVMLYVVAAVAAYFFVLQVQSTPIPPSIPPAASN